MAGMLIKHEEKPSVLSRVKQEQGILLRKEFPDALIKTCLLV